jgi:hypothetical protein
MMRAAAVLLALCLPAATVAAQDLQPFKATYAIRYNGMSAGMGELQLERLPDGRWSYRSRLQARGLFRLAMPASQESRSIFRIVDHKVVPESFISDEARQDYTFDWEAGRVTGTVDGKPLDLPIQPGLLDTTSVQVALMQDLLSGRMPTRFVLVDETRIKDYLYSVEGSERIESVVGPQRADIFSSRRPGSKKANFYWCAPDLGYLPLKMERRNGRNVELTMTLTALER